MRKAGKCLHFSLGVDSSHLGGLGDRDNSGLHVMFKANAVEKGSYLLGSYFSIRRGHRKEFAAGEFLRRTTLINVYMRGLSTDNGVIRLCDSLETENIRSRATKHKIDGNVFPKVLLELFYGSSSVRIVAISNDVARVCSGNSFNHLRMNTGIIVAGEASGWFDLFGHDVGRWTGLLVFGSLVLGLRV